MNDLNYAYTRFKENKATFEALQEINPKDDDGLYKHLLHKLRSLREDLIEDISDIQLELDSMKRVMEYEKEIIQSVNLD